MARVNLREMFDAPDEAQQPAVPDDRVEVQTPAITARVNFEVPRDVRNAFKAWCSNNDTSVKDELTAYIYRCLNNS
ncbi:hypothetical protein GQ603_16115 [Clavibacter michiganensis subsp. michiganensis]|uniref:hypothetical protein n=1 Tax=Clavibacter michiganensis TaxID=28447 RepID=UPI00142E7BD5|nr:hypothetical protein [Clavibacter michiganensis]NIY62056.1 hypothetical protein [Clavibacter michiganensis subsp. michiganensis]